MTTVKIWRSIEEIPNEITSVVTIGNFDGMHEGHRQVIATAVARARSRGVKAVACTFDPHPRIVHNPDTALKLISPLRDRLDAMAATGLDATFVIHYDASVYSLTPRDFVEKYLVQALGAVEVVVGNSLKQAMFLARRVCLVIFTASVARLSMGINEAVSWVSPPQTCAMTLKVSFQVMASTLDGLSGMSGTVVRQSSFPLRFLWGQILNLTVKYALLKRMFWVEAT